MAFDNCPVTRWRTWESAKPGQFIEVDLGQQLSLSMIRVEASADQKAAIELHKEVSSAVWKPAGVKAEMMIVPPLDTARAIASDDLKRLGFTHLALSHADFIAEDVYRNRKLWRMSLIGETSEARLYKID